jgi:hypothetical protein
MGNIGIVLFNSMAAVFYCISRSCLDYVVWISNTPNRIIWASLLVFFYKLS